MPVRLRRHPRSVCDTEAVCPAAPAAAMGTSDIALERVQAALARVVCHIARSPWHPASLRSQWPAVRIVLSCLCCANAFCVRTSSGRRRQRLSSRRALVSNFGAAPNSLLSACERIRRSIDAWQRAQALSRLCDQGATAMCVSSRRATGTQRQTHFGVTSVRSSIPVYAVKVRWRLIHLPETSGRGGGC